MIYFVCVRLMFHEHRKVLRSAEKRIVASHYQRRSVFEIFHKLLKHLKYSSISDTRFDFYFFCAFMLLELLCSHHFLRSLFVWHCVSSL